MRGRTTCQEVATSGDALQPNATQGRGRLRLFPPSRNKDYCSRIADCKLRVTGTTVNRNRLVCRLRGSAKQGPPALGYRPAIEQRSASGTLTDTPPSPSSTGELAPTAGSCGR
jgi:hypothetical protein